MVERKSRSSHIAIASAARIDLVMGLPGHRVGELPAGKAGQRLGEALFRQVSDRLLAAEIVAAGQDHAVAVDDQVAAYGGAAADADRGQSERVEQRPICTQRLDIGSNTTSYAPQARNIWRMA